MYLWHITAVLMHTNLTKSPQHLSDLTDHRHTVMPPFCFSVYIWSVSACMCVFTGVSSSMPVPEPVCGSDLGTTLCVGPHFPPGGKLGLLFAAVYARLATLAASEAAPVLFPWRQRERWDHTCATSLGFERGLGNQSAWATEPLPQPPPLLIFPFSLPSSLPPSSLPSFGTFILNWAPAQIINHHGSTECHLHVILDRHGLRSYRPALVSRMLSATESRLQHRQALHGLTDKATGLRLSLILG